MCCVLWLVDGSLSKEQHNSQAWTQTHRCKVWRVNSSPILLVLSPEYNRQIGHFWVSTGLCIKTRLSAQPLLWKWCFILMQIKLIFTRKFLHLASFWKWGFLEVGKKDNMPHSFILWTNHDENSFWQKLS